MRRSMWIIKCLFGFVLAVFASAESGQTSEGQGHNGRGSHQVQGGNYFGPGYYIGFYGAGFWPGFNNGKFFGFHQPLFPSYPHEGEILTPVCPSPKTYNVCGSMCPPTCRNPNPHGTCHTDACNPDCFCPEGKILDETSFYSD